MATAKTKTPKVKPPIVAMTPAVMLDRFGAYPHIVLGIDASSSVIGYAILAFYGQPDPGYGYSIILGSRKLSAKMPIQRRCAEGFALVQMLASEYDYARKSWPVGHSASRQIGGIAIEDAVAKYANAIMQQSRVVGAMMAAFDQLGLTCSTFAPKAGKKILSGSGVAGPDQMTIAAQAFAAQPIDEHSAHALGMALAWLDLEYPQ